MELPSCDRTSIVFDPWSVVTDIPPAAARSRRGCDVSFETLPLGLSSFNPTERTTRQYYFTRCYPFLSVNDTVPKRPGYFCLTRRSALFVNSSRISCSASTMITDNHERIGNHGHSCSTRSRYTRGPYYLCHHPRCSSRCTHPQPSLPQG